MAKRFTTRARPLQRPREKPVKNALEAYVSEHAYLCPHCLHVTPKSRGTQVQCRKCGATSRIAHIVSVHH